jgi:hypothetical protein
MARKLVYAGCEGSGEDVGPVGAKGGETYVSVGLVAGWGGADLALCCQSRMEEGGIVPPHSVLAPETALRSVPPLPYPPLRPLVRAA